MSQKPPKFPSTRSVVVIREATEEDLRLMASDVIRYLPDGLFPRLGKRFVRRWMKTFLTQHHGVALVAVTSDAQQQQVGFLIGSTNQIRHVADVLNNHKWGLLLSGLMALSIRPRVLLHFLRTRARPYLRRILRRTNGPIAGANPRPATAVITSLVVLPTLRAGASESFSSRNSSTVPWRTGQPWPSLSPRQGQQGQGSSIRNWAGHALGNAIPRTGHPSTPTNFPCRRRLGWQRRAPAKRCSTAPGYGQKPRPPGRSSLEQTYPVGVYLGCCQ